MSGRPRGDNDGSEPRRRSGDRDAAPGRGRDRDRDYDRKKGDTSTRGGGGMMPPPPPPAAAASAPSAGTMLPPPLPTAPRPQEKAASPPPPPPPPPAAKTPKFSPRGMYAEMLEKARTGEDMTDGERVVLAKMKLQGAYYDIPEALAMPAEGWMLEVVKGGEVAEEVRLDESPFYLLGKDPAVAEIAVAHPSTSRAHCALAHDPDGIGIILTDLGSSNGTFLNHKRLAPHTPTRLAFYPSDELVKPGRSSSSNEGKKRNDFFSLGASNRTYHVVPPSALYPTRAEREQREERARKSALMEAQLAAASRGAEGLDEACEEKAEEAAVVAAAAAVDSRTPTPTSKVPAPAAKEPRAAPSPAAPKTKNTLLQDDVAVRRPQAAAAAAATSAAAQAVQLQESTEAEAMEVEEAPPACADDDDVMSDAGMYDAGEEGGEGALGALREKRLARALTKELSRPGVAAGALWAPLRDILEALNGAGLPFVVVKQHVKSLVLLDPEQRFGIKKQGGEYSVSLGRVEQSKLAESSLQDSTLEADMDVIHGTSLKAWKRIAKEGLVPGSGSKYIFFTPEEPEEPGIIAGLAKPAQVYIYLDCEKAQADGLKFSKAADGTLCTLGKKGAIKTKYFSQVVSVKSQELLM